MKNRSKLVITVILALSVGACAASSTSPIGVNCNYNLEKPMWEMPLACQGR